MAKSVKVPAPVYEKIDDVKEEGDFQTYGEALRAMLRDCGHDV